MGVLEVSYYAVIVGSALAIGGLSMAVVYRLYRSQR